MNHTIMVEMENALENLLEETLCSSLCKIGLSLNNGSKLVSVNEFHHSVHGGAFSVLVEFVYF